MIKPMLAHTYDKGKNASKIMFPCYVQPKIDGVRMIWDGENYYSRTGKPLSIPIGMQEELKKYFYQFPLDGELIIPGHSFDHVSGTVRSMGIKDERLRYKVFDSIDLERQDAREANLRHAFKNIKLSFIMLLKTEILHDRKYIQPTLQLYISQGYEGLILRNTSSFYEEGKRSFNLQKLKPWHYLEVDVCGQVAGKGKHEGRMGALLISDNSQFLGKVGTGFSDFERELWSEVDTSIKRSIKVKYQEKTKDGKLRFPVFVKEIL